MTGKHEGDRVRGSEMIALDIEFRGRAETETGGAISKRHD